MKVTFGPTKHYEAFAGLHINAEQIQHDGSQSPVLVISKSGRRSSRSDWNVYKLTSGKAKNLPHTYPRKQFTKEEAARAALKLYY